MSKANSMFTDPAFKLDMVQTMGRVKAAASDVDVTAKQLHQILGKRSPLIHMVFGRPGGGDPAPDKTRETLQDGTH